MVNAGTTLRFTVVGGVAGFLFSAAELRSAALVEIARAGLDPITLDLETTDSLLNRRWEYRAVVTVKTTVDHGQLEDVKAIVTGAFWRVSDQRPTVSDGINTQPAPAGATIDDGTGGGLLDAVIGGSGLERGLLWIAVAAIALVIVVVKK